jgi:pimeloyl-ACP methyl ester carboxylesterase
MTDGIKRGFVDIEEGQVHYRLAGAREPSNRPALVLLHSSPLSSRVLSKFALVLNQNRDVIGFDTLGQGDSCAPAANEPGIDYFANATIRALRALGSHFSLVDIFGTHTGARIAADMAIDYPTRVRKIVLDGMRQMPGQLYDDYAEIIDMSRHIDADGTQFFKAWNKWRDEYLFKPPHRWDERQMTGSALPSPHDMHDAAVEVFKGIRHAHAAYRAAINYRVQERLPCILQPAMVTCASRDGSFVDLEFVGRLIPNAMVFPRLDGDRVEHSTDAGLSSFAKSITDWLDQ